MAISERNLAYARTLIADSVPISTYFRDYLNLYVSSEGKIRCPIHDESTPSFHYSDTRKRGNCFGCHAGGTVVEIHLHITRKNVPDYSQFRAIVDLARKYGIDLPDLMDPTITDALRIKKSTRERRTYSPLFYMEQLKKIPRESIYTSLDDRYTISKTLDDVFLGRISAEDGYKRCKALLRGNRTAQE